MSESVCDCVCAHCRDIERAHWLACTALENLAGDVYLYLIGEITREQLLRTQTQAIRVLTPTVTITTPDSDQWDR